MVTLERIFGTFLIKEFEKIFYRTAGKVMSKKSCSFIYTY
jgi:hypothetical protein